MDHGFSLARVHRAKVTGAWSGQWRSLFLFQASGKFCDPGPACWQMEEVTGVGNTVATEVLAVRLADHRGLLWRSELSGPKYLGCIFSALFCLYRVHSTISGRKVSPTQGIMSAFVCFRKQLSENLHVPTK